MTRVAAVPGGFAATCARGPYTALPSSGYIPLASLECSPDVASAGASQVIVRQFRPKNPSKSIVRSVFSTFPFFDLPPGDCADGSSGIGTWSIAGQDRGALACYIDETTGDALLYWSYDEAAILVRARNPRGDAAALYSFFDKYAKFIAP